MQISPPYGYSEVVPFLRSQKVRLLAPGEVPAWALKANAIPLSQAEFQPAMRDYPIVFTPVAPGKGFSPVAVLGLTPGENLFAPEGRWAPGVYVPAYARRYPFCMTRLSVNKVEQKQRLICVEKAAVGDHGEALFDDKGAPLEKWKGLERLLNEYEADLERSREMGEILSDYGLLEPFNMQATLRNDGDKSASPRKLQLTGMHRVAEKNLENLNAAQLKNLLRKGILGRIFLHLVSLENFGRLLDRKG